MKKFRLGALLLAAAFSSAPIFAATQQELLAAGGQLLTQEEMQALVPNSTLVHTRLEGSAKIEMFYRSNGSRVLFTGGGTSGRRFEGPYTIRNGQRCEASVRGGEVCSVLVKMTDGKLLHCDTSGKCDWEVTVEKGNPYGLE